ncbi:MAG: hypothetical protein ACRDKL_11140 [Solirubrobacteraceae bacterium]
MKDTIDPTLGGHPGCRDDSPPLPGEQAIAPHLKALAPTRRRTLQLTQEPTIV